MSYGYHYNSNMGVDEAIALFFGIFAITIIILGIFMVAFYLFQAIGLYTMSKRRGYKNAWLAFIPIANAYVLGGIADNINACMQKRSHHRITMLVTQIINGLVGFASASFLTDFIESAVYYSYSGTYADMDKLIVGYVFLMLLVSAVSAVYSVFYFISCYKIFTDYSNNNGVLFTVLSILLGIAPFIIFALRNKTPISLSYANGNPNGFPQGQPMYQQAPMQGYSQAPHPMYPQAPVQQPIYPQAPTQQPMYPQAPQQPVYPQPIVPQQPPIAPPPPQAPVATPPVQPEATESDNQQNN